MAPMPPAWLAVEDEESGAMYFYHERTGRTTWEHPADRCALHPLARHTASACFREGPRSLRRAAHDGGLMACSCRASVHALLG